MFWNNKIQNIQADHPGKTETEISKEAVELNTTSALANYATEAGFHFSKDEPTALVQSDGGPCAVLAPVQAFIFKSLLTDKSGINWKEVDVKKCNKYLVQAVCDILAQAISDTEGTFIVVHMNEHCDANSVPQMNMVETQQGEDGTVPSEQVEKSAGHENFHSHLKVVSFDNVEEVEEFYLQQIETLQNTFGVLLLLYSVLCTKGLEQVREEMSDPMEPLIDGTYGYGSQSLINLILTGKAVGHVWNYDQNVGGLSKKYANLGLQTPPQNLPDNIYAAFDAKKEAYEKDLVKSLNNEQRAVFDIVIDTIYTSNISSNCFLDAPPLLSMGLFFTELHGVDHQCEVGFLTLLEHLRYCEVGSFLKNPKHPIWVLASETHLTAARSFQIVLAADVITLSGHVEPHSFPAGHGSSPAQSVGRKLRSVSCASRRVEVRARALCVGVHQGWW
uniref:Ubiquitin carboxyl-terminal hydrolase MINDY n=1 Tax=Timema shepardi TaxID=629360 RepID=A0A7R9FWB8_TIMSH|nr:unnamed protein product [Timema shepardi]